MNCVTLSDIYRSHCVVQEKLILIENKSSKTDDLTTADNQNVLCHIRVIDRFPSDIENLFIYSITFHPETCIDSRGFGEVNRTINNKMDRVSLARISVMTLSDANVLEY